MVRRLRITTIASNAIPNRARNSGLKSIRILRFACGGSTPNVREVVVMTSDAVEFAGTETVAHEAPVGNPVQVKVYALAKEESLIE